MARQACGVDVGRSGARMLRGRVDGKGFVVTGFACAETPDGDLEAGWEALSPSFRPGECRVGITGREVNVRYSQVPRVPDWQLRRLMRFEAEEVSAQSDALVASDFNVLPELPEIAGEDVVLLAMARESLLERHVAGLAAVGGKLDAFTPNAIALYNAFLRYGVVLDDTVMVANVGAGSIDVIVVRGADLIFARNLNGGSELFDAALAERFDVSPERARRYKESEATLRREALRDGNQEKAYKALLAPAGQLLSLLQSTLVFCKTQVKASALRLDRVLVCGGGARLGGLPEHLAAGMGVPVERFDPFVVVDTSRLSAEESAALESRRLESVVALGLATTASDPESYSLEILPAALARRRELLHGGAFLAAAAALAFLFLGYYAWTQRGRMTSLEHEATRLESRLRAAQRHDDETRALIEENAALADRAQELHELAGSGEQLVRALAAVEGTLPEGFWIEQLTSDFGHDEALGIPRSVERPILRLRGRAREGTQATTELFQDFVRGLRERLPEMAIAERMGDTEAFFTLDLSLYGTRRTARDGAQAGTPGEPR